MSSQRIRLKGIALTLVLLIAGLGAIRVMTRALSPYRAFAPLRPNSSPLSSPTGPVQHDATDVKAEDFARIQEAVKGVPGYKDAVPLPLGEDVKFGDGAMAIAWFSTRDSGEQVLSYYDEQFRKGGFPLVRERYGRGAGYSGYLEPRTQRVHMVSVLTEGGKTLVFVSSAEAEKMLTQETQVPDALPHPPGASGNVVLSSHIEGRARRDITATVSSGSIEGLADFYQKGFVAKGWLVEGVSTGSNGDMTVTASRGRARSSALIHRMEHSSVIQLFVTLEEDAA